MNMKLYFLALVTLFFSTLSHAACQRGGGIFDNKNITVSTVNLPTNLVLSSADYTSGTVVYSSGWISGSNDQLTIQNCSRSYVVGYFYINSPQVNAAAGTTNMPTNIPGLAVRVTAMNQAGPNDSATMVDNNWHSGSGSKEDHTLRNSQYLVELVATGGHIASGTLSFVGPLAQVEFRESASRSADGDIASQVLLGSTQVMLKAMGCSADTAKIDFNFNNINVTEFDTQAKIKADQEQAVNLSCEAGTNVSLSVTAVEASGDNANHTVIALTGAGNQGVASGVGVQLGLKTRLYDSGTNGLPLNQNIMLINSTRSGNQYINGGAQTQEQLRFSASYYKTSSSVAAGTANASATLTLTYN